MAYRDRQTGEVTEQRAARLDSVREAADESPVAKSDPEDLPVGSQEPGPPPRELLEAANSAYQQSAQNAVGSAEPARPTALSFEA